MDAAVNIGVIALIIIHERVDDALRFLRRGGVVEVDERLPVDLLVEDREIGAEVGPGFVHHLSLYLILSRSLVS